MLETYRLVLFCVMFSKFEAIRFICFPSHGSRLHYVSPDRRFFLQIILLKELWKISFVLLLYLRFLFILINAFKTKIFHLLALNSYHKIFVMFKSGKAMKADKRNKEPQSCFVEYLFRNKVWIFFFKSSWSRLVLIKLHGIPLNVTGTVLQCRRFPWNLLFPIRRWSVKKTFLKFRLIHRKTPVLELA